MQVSKSQVPCEPNLTKLTFCLTSMSTASLVGSAVAASAVLWLCIVVVL